MHLAMIVSPRMVDTYFPAYIAHTEHIAEIIKRWFVIVLFPGCVERAWNLYSWACSQTAGTDSAKAPLGLTCLRRFRIAPLSIRGSNIKNVRRAKKKKDVYLLVQLISSIVCITWPLTEAGCAGLTRNKAASAFNINKLSGLCDGTQEQLLASEEGRQYKGK